MDDMDDVVELVLLLVEVIMFKGLAMLKLCDIMVLVGIDIGVDVDIDVDIVIEDGITTTAGKISISVGVLTTLGIFCDDVGADVPGSDVGVVVHWKPPGTSEGTSVPVYVTTIGTTFAVGAAVGTDG